MPSIRETIQPSGAELGFIRAKKQREEAEGGRGGGRREGRKRAEQKVIVAGMDGHTSKAAETAKVMWEWRERAWMVHQGHLSEHDGAGSAGREARAKEKEKKALRAKDKPSGLSLLAKPAPPHTHTLSN